MKFTGLKKHLKHTRLLSKTAEVIARPEETGGGAFKLGKDFQQSSFYEMCVCGVGFLITKLSPPMLL